MVWLIGAGLMAQAYYKTLQQLDLPIQVVGRSVAGCQHFLQQTGEAAIAGGVEQFLQTKPSCAKFAIVAVNVTELYSTCLALLHYGVRYILLEKPGALYQWQLKELELLAVNANATVLIGYNRRFYASVQQAKQLQAADGGVLSFHLEMTEWSHLIADSVHPPAVKNRWLIANTAHVIDLAFYLAGDPCQLQCVQAGTLHWHPAAAVMTGSGKTATGTAFSYHGNWLSAGRWSLELCTSQRRLQLMPLEQLQQQLRGTVRFEPVPLFNQADVEFKAGLLAQVQAFVSVQHQEFCTLSQQITRLGWYEQIAGYPSSVQECCE